MEPSDRGDTIGPEVVRESRDGSPDLIPGRLTGIWKAGGSGCSAGPRSRVVAVVSRGVVVRVSRGVIVTRRGVGRCIKSGVFESFVA